MKLSITLKNKGTAKQAEVILNVSYFILKNTEEEIKSQEFNIRLTNADEQKKEIDLDNSIDVKRDITILIKRPEGNVITQKNVSLRRDGNNQEVLIEFSVNTEIDLIPDNNPIESTKPAFVHGRLLDKNGIHNMENIQIIVLSKEKANDELSPFISVRTEPKGYFSFDYPDGNIIEAVAQIGMNISNNPIPIKLDETISDDGTSTISFPKRVVLVAEISASQTETDDDKAEDCGCNSLNIDEKRVLEEFSHFSLIRTSEPEIQGFVIEEEEELSLEDILDNLTVSGSSVLGAISKLPLFTATVAFTNPSNQPNESFQEKLKNIPIKKTVLNSFLKEEKSLGAHNVEKLLQYNESEKLKKITTSRPPKSIPLGRIVLNTENIIDWDDKPTIYQSVEVAHGHLLQFKTEWLADGYSLGDLLYSLPLAPGQKKQIVVFDWERREAITNTQSTDFEESLSSSLNRDRDILEVANGTVSERLDGRSSATTASIAGGMFGSFFGIAGGAGHSRSNATQNSLRKVASSDFQRLRDSINQSANAIRSLRSTIVQTTSQGERFEVSSESVANYNHCHAITIQYYEVLRHLKVRQRFSGARECLFIPLIMTTFDLKKALRWKEPLQLMLLDKSLSNAFDAAGRIEHRWSESDFPDGTFASERIITANGFINVKFELERPADDYIEVTDYDRPVVVTVPATSGGFPTRQTEFPHTKKQPVFHEENWNVIKDYMDGIDPETFYNTNLANATDKDAVFHRLLGAKITRNYINDLKFEALNAFNNSVGTVTIDPSLTSRYHRNGNLRVSLRMIGTTNIKREDFHYLKITTTANVGFSVLVRSGLMKYKTAHFDGFLFNYQRIEDDISNEDGAHIYTGPSHEELQNPKKEDVALANQLIAHLNDNLEYYHKAIWTKMTPQRRFMLLDGIILNGKGEGRSVASLVENELLAIVGNSMVFPVAPGLNLNPDFGIKESLDEFYQVAVSEPLSISIPTKGVFAESVMGNCNACEEKDESRFWRWEESPIPDSPTTINPVNTDSRRAEPNLQTQPLPNPIVNIQNAPNAPDPTGLAATIGLLGKGDTFRDVTGLELNQKNALAALQSSLSASEALAKEGAKLEVQKTMEKRLDSALNKINASKNLSPEKKAELTEKALNAFIGGGAEKAEVKKKDPDNAKFEEAAKMIDQLEKGGILSPEDAKEARETIKKNLEGSNSNIIDKASEKGVDVNISEPDGKKIEVKTNDVSLGAKGILDIQSVNTSEAKTFNPASHDITGESILKSRVTPKSASSVQNYKWTEVGKSNLTISTPSNATTKIFGSLPGMTKVRLEVSDANDNILDFDETEICSPQFVFVGKGTANYTTVKPALTDSHLFDAVLREFKVADSEVQILQIAKALTRQVLRRINVRVIWDVLSEQPPSFIGSNNANTIALQGWPRTGKSTELGLTELNPQTSAAGSPNELIFIWLGQLEANSDFNPILADYLALANIANPTAGQKAELNKVKDVWVTILGRVMGYAISHEIVHSLLGKHAGLDSSGHTLTTETTDLISPKLTPDMIGLEFKDPTQPKNFQNIKSTNMTTFVPINANNMKRLMKIFPTPPEPPFA